MTGIESGITACNLSRTCTYGLTVSKIYSSYAKFIRHIAHRPRWYVVQTMNQSITCHISPSWAVWGVWYWNHVSQAGLSNCIPHNILGSNYLSPPDIPASGTDVFTCMLRVILYSIMWKALPSYIDDSLNWNNIYIYILCTWIPESALISFST